MPIRIYYEGEIRPQKTVILGEAASRHLLRVLRCKMGDSLMVFNGRGGEFQACLKDVQKACAVVEIADHTESAVESPLFTHLAQGISRGECMDYVIQKSAELGVNKITPLFTERCGVKMPEERLKKRVKHWQSVAISACEQSGRCLIPRIMKPMPLTDWLSEYEGQGFVCDPTASQRIDAYLAPDGPVSVLIGPEGGFTEGEVEQALAAEFQPLSLGPRILRTETAAVVAQALIQRQWGDL